MPEPAVPFPHSVDQASCPDLHASDPENLFFARSSATNLMNQQAGHVTARPHSLRWSHVPTHAQDSAPLRFPSIASPITYTNNLQHPDGNCSIQGEDLPDNKNEIPPRDAHWHHGHPMASKRVSSLPESQKSILQHVARPFSKKASAEILSLNSAGSSPVTPTTPLFPPNPAIADFTKSPFPNTVPYSTIDRGNLSKHANMQRFAQDEKPKFTGRLRKEPRNLRVEHKEISTFDPHIDMTSQQLRDARNLDVLDLEGKKFRFGILWQGQLTCVIFIRHFWLVETFRRVGLLTNTRCPSCMDYIRSIKEQVDPDVLDKAGVRLVIISNGSPAMIKSYSSKCFFVYARYINAKPSFIEIFNLPFPLYTDPTCALYRALGMTLRTTDGGPDSERGDYIRHGAATGVAMVLKNALSTRMPLYKRVGDAKQLGGEFILGPG
jgi:AhpC/TSA antioxidant enzyme